jgi:hypothetical protein
MFDPDELTGPNAGRKKFGKHFLNFTGAHSEEDKAINARDQYRALGIPAEILKEPHETPWYPHDLVEGFSVYARELSYHRPQKNATKSGVSRNPGRRF